MKTAQLQWNDGKGWTNTKDEMKEPQPIFAFGGQASPKADAVGKLKEMYPNASIVGCSTAGEILEDDVYDDTMVATAIQFDSTKFEIAKTEIDSSNGDSFKAGEELAKKFNQDGLAGLFVLSDGLQVNGSELGERTPGCSS